MSECRGVDRSAPAPVASDRRHQDQGLARAHYLILEIAEETQQVRVAGPAAHWRDSSQPKTECELEPMGIGAVQPRAVVVLNAVVRPLCEGTIGVLSGVVGVALCASSRVFRKPQVAARTSNMVYCILALCAGQ